MASSPAGEHYLLPLLRHGAGGHGVTGVLGLLLLQVSLVLHCLLLLVAHHAVDLGRHGLAAGWNIGGRGRVVVR